VNEEMSDDPIGRVHDFLLEANPAARASLAAIRDVRAAGPGPGAETLRGAYLDLLKLCLCDLGAATTTSVGSMPGGDIASRVLRGDQLRVRAAGLDWPLQGLTMIGLGRLDDLQSCVESVVDDGVPGDLIEAGAWRGGASILMRATLDTLGDRERTVWVADSFQGFPDDEAGEHVDLSAYEFLAVPVEEVEANFARFGCDRGVRFVPGFFEDTLPGLSDRRWAIVRLDGDTYEATLTALKSLYPGLAPGGYLIIDDYGAFEECRRAVDEFRAGHRITEPLEQIDWTGMRWRRESDAPIEVPSPSASTAGREPAPRTPRASGARKRDIPTIRELEMERELADLRERLAAAERPAERRLRLFRR
jgi:O-methyltransferase